MSLRENVEFKADDGVVLRGWLYRPDADGRRPLIAMTHGFGVHKEMGLDSYAQALCDDGNVVLAYDFRNWGESDGEPRFEMDPWAQIRDYRTALTYGSLLPFVDRERLGVWGTSYSGGHVLVVAAIDRRVRCVVSMVPTISGMTKAIRVHGAEGIKALRRRFDADREARFRGEPPEVNVQFDLESEVHNPSIDWFRTLSADQKAHWKNRLTLRSEEMRLEYEPGAYVSRISPTPLLIITATDDTNAYTDLALGAYERALEPKSVRILTGNHFSPYGENRDEAIQASRDWFARHL